MPIVSDVKWVSDGGSFSISGNSDGEGTTYLVGLQNAKLNKLPQGEGEIVIYFNNGTTVKAGTISVTAPASSTTK